MKSKTIGMLAGITVVVIGLAVFLNREGSSPIPKSGTLLFPELMSVVNEVNEVRVETFDQTMTLVKGERGWGLKEKQGYPADLEKVKQVIVGLANLRIHEPKTKNPELYERLGLEGKDQEGSVSTVLTLKTADNPKVATLVVGNQKPSKGNPRASDMYVRKPEDPQTWLVIGNLPLEKMPAEWLDKEVTALTSKRVKQVLVTHPNGKTLQVSKAQPEDLDFQLDSVPVGFKVSSQFNLNNVVGTLVQLSLEDVKAETDVPFSNDSGVNAVLETFDGLRLHVQTTKVDEKVFGKFSAEFDQDLVQTVEQAESGKPPSEENAPQETNEKGEQTGSLNEAVTDSAPKDPIVKPAAEVQKEVKELNARVKGWIYELPAFRVENFSKLKKDLLSKEEAPGDLAP